MLHEKRKKREFFSGKMHYSTVHFKTHQALKLSINKEYFPHTMLFLFLLKSYSKEPKDTNTHYNYALKYIKFS